MSTNESAMPIELDDDLIAVDVSQAPEMTSKARRTLARRLADVICLPQSQVNALERHMAGDLLVEMLKEGDRKLRLQCAQRMAALADAPASVLRLLIRDEIDIASPLLEESKAISNADLIECIAHSSPSHRVIIAKRKEVAEQVSEALVLTGDIEVIQALLRNQGAVFSFGAMDRVVALSRDNTDLIKHVLRREELRPSHAYAIFWWASPLERAEIVKRLAIGRDVLQNMAGDVFAMCAEEGWQDPLARKALQFIERRQRNRAAIDKSPYDSLEHAIEVASEQGLSRELTEEISFLAGVKPATGARILTDLGGEPIAVLCKATGLKRENIELIWKSQKRPVQDESGKLSEALERTVYIYDIMTVDKAQTLLRYWNWSLTASLTPELLQAIRDGTVEEEIDEFSPPSRTAALVFSKFFK